MLSPKELLMQPWIPSLLAPVRAVVRTGLISALGSGTSVCRIHGDFGSENLFVDRDRFWVIDWERSTGVGPAVADRVAYWLGANLALARRAPVEALRVLKTQLAQHGSFSDMCVALAFLSTAEFGPARSLFLEGHA